MEYVLNYEELATEGLHYDVKYNVFGKKYYLPKFDSKSFDLSHILDAIGKKITKKQNKMLFFACSKDYPITNDNLKLGVLDDIDSREIVSGIMIILNIYDHLLLTSKTGIIYKSLNQDSDTKEYILRLFLYILYIKLSTGMNEENNILRNSLLKSEIFKEFINQKILSVEINDLLLQKTDLDGKEEIKKQKEPKFVGKFSGKTMMEMFKSKKNTKKKKKSKQKKKADGDNIVSFFKICHDYYYLIKAVKELKLETISFDEDNFDTTVNKNTAKKKFETEIIDSLIKNPVNAKVVVMNKTMHHIDRTFDFLDRATSDKKIIAQIGDQTINDIGKYSCYLKNYMNTPVLYNFRNARRLLNDKNYMEEMKLAIENNAVQVNELQHLLIENQKNEDLKMLGQEKKKDNNNNNNNAIIEEGASSGTYNNDNSLQVSQNNENRLNTFIPENKLKYMPLVQGKYSLDAIENMANYNSMALDRTDFLNFVYEKFNEKNIEVPKSLTITSKGLEILKEIIVEEVKNSNDSKD